MLPLTPKALTKAYLIVVLIIGVLVSPLPQFALALVLLALTLYMNFRHPSSGFNLALTVATLIFAPLLLVPLTGSLLSVALIAPGVYLFDQNLRQNTTAQNVGSLKPGRKATPTLAVLTVTLLAILTASAMIFNQTLLLSTAVLTIYLTAILAYDFHKIPKNPLKETKTCSRILVGDTETKSMKLSSETNTPLSVTLTSPEPWIHIGLPNFVLKLQTEVNLTFTPPLAGPSKLQLQAAAIDPWGLIQTNQTLEPIDLHIIPKAKYAQWLAKKYLEQTASGTASTAEAPSPKALKASKSGVEYYGSRLYQPGDRLKNVDWKHTFMLDELIVKEFAGAHGQPTIIVADLTAKNAQDADKLAYNVVMAALTSATESLPSGIAVYNRKEVLAAVAPTNPRETLKRALQITEKIAIVEQPLKVMEPTEMGKLKGTIRALDQTKTEFTKNLTKILEFECEVTETAAKMHPATQALAKCIQKTAPPAMITVASPMGFDSEALTLALEKLKTKGYSTIRVST